ncbi:MAG: hypothetical protein AAGB31_12535, partial [Bdellovibrio sp.]
PMSVAKVALNRATTENASLKKVFIQGSHSPLKGELAKVVTTSNQFNVWMSDKTHREGPLRQALCPPNNSQKEFWTGKRPPQMELDIWRNTVRIATEAVLAPKNSFTKRTKGVTGHYYTSGMDKFYNMKQVFPWIEQRQIKNNACVQLWSPS